MKCKGKQAASEDAIDTVCSALRSGEELPWTSGTIPSSILILKLPEVGARL